MSDEDWNMQFSTHIIIGFGFVWQCGIRLDYALLQVWKFSVLESSDPHCVYTHSVMRISVTGMCSSPLLVLLLVLILSGSVVSYRTVCSCKYGKVMFWII